MNSKRKELTKKKRHVGGLNPWQMECLALIGMGLETGEIASRMNLTDSGVEHHVGRLCAIFKQGQKFLILLAIAFKMSPL